MNLCGMEWIKERVQVCLLECIYAIHTVGETWLDTR